MENRLLIAGFGGQGVMLMGQLLGYGASAANKYATYFPSYGPEMRGGTANCTVVISDEEIASPLPSRVDVLVAMNQPSLDKYLENVEPGGLVILNTSHIHKEVERDDVKVLHLPADDIAKDLEAPKAANMVVLGAYLEYSKAFTLEGLLDTLKVQMAKKAAYFDKNKAAVYAGAKVVQDSK